MADDILHAFGGSGHMMFRHRGHVIVDGDCARMTVSKQWTSACFSNNISFSICVTSVCYHKELTAKGVYYHISLRASARV